MVPEDNLNSQNNTIYHVNTDPSLVNSVPIKSVSTLIHNPITPQPALNQILPSINLINPPSISKTTTINTLSTLNLNGVDSSLGAYLRRKIMYVILVIILAVAISIVQPFFGLFIIAIGYYIAKLNYENGLFKSFAVANNFNFQKNGIVTNQTGHIFYIGNDRKVLDVISGNYSHQPIFIFLYQYSVGYGRNRQTYHRVVLNLSFNVNLPTFILRRSGLKAKLNEEGERISDNGYTEKIQLEGDFNKHFNVYIPPNTGQDVLTILTPDIMELLIPLDKYEIELTPNGEFYLYTYGYITKRQELVDMYKIVELIVNKIGSFANLEKKVQENNMNIAQDTSENQIPTSTQPLTI